MFKIFIILVFLCLFNLSEGKLFRLATRLRLQGDPSPPGSPWPMPHSLHYKPHNHTITSNIFMLDNIEGSLEVKRCDIIVDNLRRVQKTVKDMSSVETGRVNKLYININRLGCEDYPRYGDDERYNLTVRESGITLTANEVWGTIRGLETISQLIFEQDKLLLIRETDVMDAPRFPYRGLMLDTARHYIPMKILLQNLDIMQWNKLNVFHWHLVDDQSFPFVSRVYPELSQQGAFSSRHVYRPSDVHKLVSYARLRGIRVIPEFDTPGHSKSWGNSHPELLTSCWGQGRPDTANYPLHSEREIMDPSKNSTFTFLERFFEDVVDMFPDKTMHLGMDEAYPACWESSPNISEFMKQQNISDYAALQTYYSHRVAGIVRRLGAQPMMWQDPIDYGAQPDTDNLIHIWKDKSLSPKLGDWRKHSAKVVSLGYDYVLSAPWYLNYISYGNNWKNFYETDPLDFPGRNETNIEQLKGGEACLWAEYVDGTNLISRTWPRASAVAERLWSPSHVNNTDNAMWRLHEHRCRMLRRGVPAQPIFNSFCGEYEWGMNEERNLNLISGSNVLSGQVLLFILTVLSHTTW